MDYKEQKIKEFSDLFDNNFLQWDLTDKLGMKERAEAFFYKTLEEQEREHGQQIADLNNMLRKQEEEIEFRQKAIDKLIDRVKSLVLNEKEVLEVLIEQDHNALKKNRNGASLKILAKAIIILQGEK